MSVIKGIDVKKEMGIDIEKRVSALKDKGVETCIAIVKVGHDPSQEAYERGAIKTMVSYDIKCDVVELAEEVSQSDLEETVKKLNNDNKVHGIMILQPLPKNLSILPIKEMINPIKDVDSISPVNLYKTLVADESGHAPCTAEAVIEILDYLKTEYKGKKCAVVGCSFVVGRPLGLMLLSRDATVVFCHEFTKDVVKETRDADILISAAGVAKLIKSGHVNKNMMVMDVGINLDKDGKMCGDVDFCEVEPEVKIITPVPGGVGTVTSTVLAKHVVKAAEVQTK